MPVSEMVVPMTEEWWQDITSRRNMAHLLVCSLVVTRATKGSEIGDSMN
jgi:hypothetical protein